MFMQTSRMNNPGLFFGDMSEPGKRTRMNALENLKLICISILFVAGLTACNKPEPVKISGKKIDQTADETGKLIGKAVKKSGEKPGVQGEKSSVVINDVEITAKVKAAIFAEPSLETLQINVDTVKSVVTLSGSVDSLASSDMAEALAVAVTGVKEVINLLVQDSAIQKLLLLLVWLKGASLH